MTLLDLPITGILLAVFLIGGIAGIFLMALWDWWSEQSYKFDDIDLTDKEE
jgi:hypothetical protein